MGVTAESIDKPISEKVDMLFLGGEVYMWDMDKTLKQYMEVLNPQMIGKIVGFSTTGAMDVTLKRIRGYGEKKEIPVSDEQLLLVMLLKGHAGLGMEGGKLSDKQKEKIREFMKNLTAKARFCTIE